MRAAMTARLMPFTALDARQRGWLVIAALVLLMLFSVVWSVTLGRYGVTLEAGEVILSGSLVPLEPARADDRFRLDLESIGGASISFAA